MHAGVLYVGLDLLQLDRLRFLLGFGLLTVLANQVPVRVNIFTRWRKATKVAVFILWHLVFLLSADKHVVSFVLQVDYRRLYHVTLE